MKTFNDHIQISLYSKQNPNELTEFKRLYKGSLKENCFYLNGNQHGEYKWFNEHSDVKEQCFYKNGKKHGEYKWFYNDGTINKQIFYQNGHRHGEYKFFNRDGTIKENCFYLDDNIQPHLQYLTTDRDNVTLTLLFGDNYDTL